MFYLLLGVGALCFFNLMLLILIGMNIIQLREVIQSFMEGPPIRYEQEDDDEGLLDVATSQIPYSTEPLIEE
jgi:hypothetical protein